MGSSLCLLMCLAGAPAVSLEELGSDDEATRGRAIAAARQRPMAERTRLAERMIEQLRGEYGSTLAFPALAVVAPNDAAAVRAAYLLEAQLLETWLGFVTSLEPEHRALVAAGGGALAQGRAPTKAQAVALARALPDYDQYGVNQAWAAFHLLKAARATAQPPADGLHEVLMSLSDSHTYAKGDPVKRGVPTPYANEFPAALTRALTPVR